jgi:tRNA-2-methylthio-N6-dimethylallyladenosine synthase
MNSQLKKFHLLVMGCQMNRADAERIEKILTDFGWQKIDQEIGADLIVVVACSVRKSAVDRVYGKAANWRKRRRAGQLKTILTGCVLDVDKKKLADRFDEILSITEIGKLPEILGDGKNLPTGDYLCLPASRESTFSAFVPISNGCNNFCSYCAVPYTRGREVSRDAASIIKECRELIKAGYKEIVLLGQNVNSYKSGDYDFPKLLQKIDSIIGDYWIRFLTSHPKDLSDGLIETMASGRHVTPYLHLALQSGDDEILKKMNRHYTAKHYLDLIKKAKAKIPNLSVSTDVIVGFPGETKKQFKQTVELMKQAGFSMAYLAQYSPRPQTAAAKLKNDVPKAEKKRREDELNEVLKATALADNRRYEGLVVKVLVDGYRKGKCYGKTENSKIVSFVGDEPLIGKFAPVLVVKAGSFSLEGRLA